MRPLIAPFATKQRGRGAVLPTASRQGRIGRPVEPTAPAEDVRLRRKRGHALRAFDAPGRIANPAGLCGSQRGFIRPAELRAPCGALGGAATGSAVAGRMRRSCPAETAGPGRPCGRSRASPQDQVRTGPANAPPPACAGSTAAGPSPTSHGLRPAQVSLRSAHGTRAPRGTSAIDHGMRGTHPCDMRDLALRAGRSPQGASNPSALARRQGCPRAGRPGPAGGKSHPSSRSEERSAGRRQRRANTVSGWWSDFQGA